MQWSDVRCYFYLLETKPKYIVQHFLNAWWIYCLRSKIPNESIGVSFKNRSIFIIHVNLIWDINVVVVVVDFLSIIEQITCSSLTYLYKVIEVYDTFKVVMIK